MDYRESADRLQALQRRRPKLGTETTSRLLAHLGNPHEQLRCVQIAGSNGKGSTAKMLESVLRAEGTDVGLFVSPGLNGFREQITVNGRRIPESRVVEFVERIDPCLEELRAEDDMPTHFEVVTALSLFHFAREDAEVAVLEVGIGGRYDATSAVDPVASAVTSVSLEHTDLLGDTVEEIARDKAQVAPADAPLVTGATGAALAAIRSEADVITVGGPDADVSATEEGMRSAIESEVSIVGADWTVETPLGLLGQHQATNAGIAATLARQVAGVDEEPIADGLRTAALPGRFEIRSTEPMIALDGAHNPDAVARVAELLERYEYDDLHVVFGAMADKDHERMIEALPAVETAVATRPNIDRAMDPAALADAFDGHARRTRRIDSVPEATEQAIDAADDDDFVLVIGSLYAVAEARDRWTRLVVPKDRRPTAASRGTTERQSEAGVAETRTFSIPLRPEQATTVEERFQSLGGACRRPGPGPSEKLVTTVLSGTDAQFRDLADAIAADGLGLGRVAEQFETALDASPAPFGIDPLAVMGILNVTPDSFYDGGEYNRTDVAVERAEEMVAAGADIIDIGGESTRPGADPVPVETEIERVVPVIEAVSALGVPISVDTRKAAVADAALEAGADIVNDVSGLSDPEMRFVVADHDASVVVMHSLSAPVDPDRTVTYDDVVADVRRDLTERVLRAEVAGVDRSDIVVDPGCGFGKSAEESFELADRLRELAAFNCPIMIGHSRKSMFESVSASGGDRLPPTLAVTTMAAERGASIVRVHDADENAAVVRTVAETNGWTR